MQHVGSVQVKAGEIVQLEKQLTENARSHQDAMFEKHKELSALQAQLDKVDADLCLFFSFKFRVWDEVSEGSTLISDST